MEKPKCPKCDKKVTEKTKFCPECGTKIPEELKPKVKKAGFFYRINFALSALLIWLLNILLIFLIFSRPDNDIRFASYIPYMVILVLLGFISALMHLILRRKTEYHYRGKGMVILAIFVIILLLISAVIPVFIGKIAYFRHPDCYDEYKYYRGCNRVEEYRCTHYSFMGLGECDACRKTICPGRS